MQLLQSERHHSFVFFLFSRSINIPVLNINSNIETKGSFILSLETEDCLYSRPFRFLFYTFKFNLFLVLTLVLLLVIFFLILISFLIISSIIFCCTVGLIYQDKPFVYEHANIYLLLEYTKTLNLILLVATVFRVIYSTRLRSSLFNFF